MVTCLLPKGSYNMSISIGTQITAQTERQKYTGSTCTHKINLHTSALSMGLYAGELPTALWRNICCTTLGKKDGYSILLNPICSLWLSVLFCNLWIDYTGRHYWHPEIYCSLMQILNLAENPSTQDWMSSVQIGRWEHQTFTSITSWGKALPCSKTYLFPPGRCSLARLVKPETVDQIFSQAHCAVESFWMWLG